MLVNVTDVFTSEGKVLTQEFAWETAEITHDGSSYPVKSSSKLLLKLTNTAQGEALVEAKLQFVAGIPCDRPDCKGLCPVCGKDLNTGACGCDTFVPDPRMAAIMDVFNANKEV